MHDVEGNMVALIETVVVDRRKYSGSYIEKLDVLGGLP